MPLYQSPGKGGSRDAYGHDNPQIFFLYERPAEGKETDIGHVREYTVYELGETVKAAGFEIVHLFTTFINIH